MDHSLISPLADTIIYAGTAVMDIYRAQKPQTQIKSDGSQVTQADLAAHQILIDFLDSTNYPVISEEGTKLPKDFQAAKDSFWLVDPLDGTKEFLARNGEFTINVAFVYQGDLNFGMVYVPVSHQLFVGDIQKGRAYCITNFKLPVHNQLRISNRITTSPPIEELVILDSRSHSTEKVLHFSKTFENSYNRMVIQHMGSSLKMCQIAMGQAHYYPKFGPTMPWDTAAAHAVLKAAGGSLFDIDSSVELQYHEPLKSNPHFVARYY